MNRMSCPCLTRSRKVSFSFCIYFPFWCFPYVLVRQTPKLELVCNWDWLFCVDVFEKDSSLVSCCNSLESSFFCYSKTYRKDKIFRMVSRKMFFIAKHPKLCLKSFPILSSRVCWWESQNLLWFHKIITMNLEWKILMSNHPKYFLFSVCFGIIKEVQVDEIRRWTEWAVRDWHASAKLSFSFFMWFPFWCFPSVV